MGEIGDNSEHQSALKSARLPPFLRFLLPSLIGVALFLLPISINGKSTILLGYITNLIKLPLQPYAVTIVASVVILATFGGGYYLLVQPDWKKSHPTLYAFCHVEPAWFLLRLLGAIFAFMVENNNLLVGF